MMVKVTSKYPLLYFNQSDYSVIYCCRKLNSSSEGVGESKSGFFSKLRTQDKTFGNPFKRKSWNTGQIIIISKIFKNVICTLFCGNMLTLIVKVTFPLYATGPCFIKFVFNSLPHEVTRGYTVLFINKIFAHPESKFWGNQAIPTSFLWGWVINVSILVWHVQ